MGPDYRFLVRLDIVRVVRHICLTMKTATVRDLRNRFAAVSRWIEEGEEVRITKRGRVFARIVPEPPASPGSRKVPDFARRVRRIFGETRLTRQESRELREYWKGDR